MSLQLLDLGRPESIDLPLDAVQGSLAVFENRGRSTPSGSSPSQRGGSTSPSTTTTTTAHRRGGHGRWRRSRLWS